MQIWHEISTQIAAITNSHYQIKETVAIGGGCINQTYCASNGSERYFVKLNSAGSLDMFEAEAAGLIAISQSQTIRVPEPICFGQNTQAAWLVLEFLDIKRSVRGNAANLGLQLAAMHRTTSNQFGWNRDNSIGQTPQINTFSSDWGNFWKIQRLGYQLDLAKKMGFGGGLQKQGELLLLDLDVFFKEYAPSPSLLHGDLWNGNYAYDELGNPVLFDPAVYYGDRETDIAMTELFGGFSVDFYSAYQNDYPLDSGYNIRKLVYNLYHVLNHLNLFGSSYLRQAEQMINRLLAEIR